MAPRRPSDLGTRLGRRIVELREAAGLTQEALAWRIETRTGQMDKGYMSRIERGKRVPSVDVLEQIADHLGVELRDLFAFDDAPADAGAPVPRRRRRR